VLLEGSVIVEIKAVAALAQVHEVRLVNYGLEIGLLLNFGAASLQIKRKRRKFGQD
jgi:GxxExxY protein